jgi:hypothetical protein
MTKQKIKEAPYYTRSPIYGLMNPSERELYRAENAAHAAALVEPVKPEPVKPGYGPDPKQFGGFPTGKAAPAPVAASNEAPVAGSAKETASSESAAASNDAAAGWDAALRRARGVTPVSDKPVSDTPPAAAPVQTSEPKDFGWGSAFAAAHHRAAIAIEVNPEGGEKPNMTAADALAEKLLAARSGRR